MSEHALISCIAAALLGIALGIALDLVRPDGKRASIIIMDKK